MKLTPITTRCIDVIAEPATLNDEEWHEAMVAKYGPGYDDLVADEDGEDLG